MVTSCFPPSVGGQERCVFELATRMKRLGHDLTIVTNSRGLPPGAYNRWTDKAGQDTQNPSHFSGSLSFPQIPLLADGTYTRTLQHFEQVIPPDVVGKKILVDDHSSDNTTEIEPSIISVLVKWRASQVVGEV
jgi:hypothetical protein